MSRPLGGYIGHTPVPAAAGINSAARGMWTLREAQRFTQATAWPFSLPEPDWLNVSLLLPMDGTNNSTVFTDAGPGARVVTANGNAKISTAQSKFIGASAVFDGNGDFLSVPNNAAFDFGNGDFVIEAWVYINANSAPDFDGGRGAAICSTWNVGSPPISGWILAIGGNSTTTGTGLQLDSWNGLNDATLFRTTVSIAHSTWHHIAASVIGGVRRIYLNGALVTNSQTINLQGGYTPVNSLGNDLRIGSTGIVEYPLFLNGYIDNLRITKGSGRGYSGATIPVPTEAFPTATSAAAAATPAPARVSGLQLWLDAADATTLFDATSGGSLVAADGTVARWEDKSGNARHATQATGGSRPLRRASGVNGLGALDFDGTNDWLSTSVSLFSGLTSLSWFAVVKNDDSGANNRAVFGDRVDGDDGGLFFTKIGTSSILYSRGSANASTRVDVSESVSFPTSAMMASMVTTSSTGTARRNGVSAGTNTTTTASVAYLNATAIGNSLASTGGPSILWWDGLICEIIVYDTALSDTNRSAVEQYLMNKWSIT